MISLIAAIGNNNELGKNGDLCWRIKADLQRFKKLTTGHTVVMGYNTYKSLGFKPLKDRDNIVITDYPLEEGAEGVTQISTKSEMRKGVLRNDFKDFVAELQKRDDEVFIIGGAYMYNYFMPYADKVYLTLINKEDKEADAYFPEHRTWTKDYYLHIEEITKEYAYYTYTKKK